jgi:hypothetical protein
MRFHSFRMILFVGLALLFGRGHAAAPAATLNQKQIHDAYNEGNFEYVISTLENFLRSNKTTSHADSIFVTKHLAVVYSANPATRERGRYYMNRLLEMLPSAKLVDMYVSEEIDRIFDKVREEFVTRQQSFGISGSDVNLPARPTEAGSGNSGGSSSTASGATSEGVRPAKKENHALLWIAGGVGLAAAGTAAYFALQADPSPGEDKIYAVPE